MISTAQLRTLIDSREDLRAIADTGDMPALAAAVLPHLPPVQRTEPFMVTELVLDVLYGFTRASEILLTMEDIASGTDFETIPQATRFQIGRLKRLLVTKEIDANFGGSQTQLAGLVAMGILTQSEADTWATLSYRAADSVSVDQCGAAVQLVLEEGE